MCIISALLFIVVLFLVICLFLSRFVSLEPCNFEGISIVNDGIRDYALVRFLDHSPWSHSRFFVAEYDLQQRKITLKEYYMPYHPFSKTINTSNIVVLNHLEGQYDVWVDKSFVGKIEFSNEQIKWLPKNNQVK
ncbi:MAG: hypothetical protein LBC20_11105 [Planctomycetaceae bacterium]|jgi:hypothetical protein|nr:hypothetical protein [Planctomycetaceae bacterium]